MTPHSLQNGIWYKQRWRKRPGSQPQQAPNLKQWSFGAGERESPTQALNRRKKEGAGLRAPRKTRRRARYELVAGNERARHGISEVLERNATAKECRLNAETCLCLARESREIYVKMALIELANEFVQRPDT
jgi:hypothetical protein